MCVPVYCTFVLKSTVHICFLCLIYLRKKINYTTFILSVCALYKEIHYYGIYYNYERAENVMQTSVACIATFCTN
jgi:hypothetical protein